MLKRLITIPLCIFLFACSESRDTAPTTTSIDNTNASSISKLGFLHFIALHSNEVLARNTITASPGYASPCTSGNYTVNFNDANNNNTLDKGDSVAESYANCVLNTGEIRVSGNINSAVTDLSTRQYSLEVQHNNLTINTLNNAKSATFNGPITTTITADLSLSNIENVYRDYTVEFDSISTTINSGTAAIEISSLNSSYSIKHSLVFSATGVTGLLRTDTTTEVIGISANNQPLLSGNPSLSAADEEAAITANTISANDRKAFRPFIGRLRIESIIDNQFVEMTSEDGDDDATTYQQNVRANRTTTSTLGHKWVDLL